VDAARAREKGSDKLPLSHLVNHTSPIDDLQRQTSANVRVVARHSICKRSGRNVDVGIDRLLAVAIAARG
jgi:hypothetical protein